MNSIIVIGETDGDEIKEVSQQVAAVASGMGEVIGIVMGKNIADAAMKLATSKIIIADDDSLEYYDSVKYAAIVSQVVGQTGATKVLIAVALITRNVIEAINYIDHLATLVRHM